MNKNIYLIIVVFTSCFILFISFGKKEFKKTEQTSGLPQRIISLGPVITEELFLLGVGDKVVGTTKYCVRPLRAQNIEKVGSVIKSDLEKIMSLKPDIIFATSLSNKEQVEKLKNMGLNIVEYISPKNFLELCDRFLEIGGSIGKKEEARMIITKVKAEAHEIKKETELLAKTGVFIQVGADPLFTVTKNSFIHSFIDLAGGENIAFDAETGQYSREEVLKRNPDVIIIVTMGIVGEEEKKIWQKYKTINAVKSNRIFVMDSYKVCSPTPITFIETLKEFVEILHPPKKAVNIE